MKISLAGPNLLKNIQKGYTISFQETSLYLKFYYRFL